MALSLHQHLLHLQNSIMFINLHEEGFVIQHWTVGLPSVFVLGFSRTSRIALLSDPFPEDSLLFFPSAPWDSPLEMEAWIRLKREMISSCLDLLRPELCSSDGFLQQTTDPFLNLPVEEEEEEAFSRCQLLLSPSNDVLGESAICLNSVKLHRKIGFLSS